MLVDESSGISVAKSTLEDPTLVRPKPSISTAAAQSSGTTSPANTQSSLNGAVAGTSGGRFTHTHRKKRDADNAPLVLLGLHATTESDGDGQTTHISKPEDELTFKAVSDKWLHVLEDGSGFSESTTNSLPGMILSVTNPIEQDVFEGISTISPLAEESPIEVVDSSFDDSLPQNDGPADTEPVDIDFVSLENLSRIEPSVHNMDEDNSSAVPVIVPYVVESHPADHIKYEMHGEEHLHDKYNADTQNVSESEASIPMQRILVNVSIATDSGSGTQHHAVYMLHVSVPAGVGLNPPVEQHVLENATMGQPPLDMNSQDEHSDTLADGAGCHPPEPPPVPPCPCECVASRKHEETNNIEEVTATTVAQINELTTQLTPTTELKEIPGDPSPTFDQSMACLNSQEIPTILILEGEPHCVRIVNRCQGSCS